MTLQFSIGDKVTATLNPDFLGLIVAITEREEQYCYSVSFFKDGEPLTCSMFGFEIALVGSNGGLGFKK